MFGGVPFSYVRIRSRLGLDFARDDGAKEHSARAAGGRGTPLPNKVVFPSFVTRIGGEPPRASVWVGRVRLFSFLMRGISRLRLRLRSK